MTTRDKIFSKCMYGLKLLQLRHSENEVDVAQTVKYVLWLRLNVWLRFYQMFEKRSFHILESIEAC